MNDNRWRNICIVAGVVLLVAAVMANRIWAGNYQSEVRQLEALEEQAAQNGDRYAEITGTAGGSVVDTEESVSGETGSAVSVRQVSEAEENAAVALAERVCGLQAEYTRSVWIYGHDSSREEECIENVNAVLAGLKECFGSTGAWTEGWYASSETSAVIWEYLACEPEDGIVPVFWFARYNGNEVLCYAYAEYDPDEGMFPDASVVRTTYGSRMAATNDSGYSSELSDEEISDFLSRVADLANRQAEIDDYLDGVDFPNKYDPVDEDAE